jgi:hypothetical protein
MLIEVSMRVTMKDPDKEGREVTDYLPCLLQTETMSSVMPTPLDGVLQVKMLNGEVHMVKEKLEYLKEKGPRALKPVKGGKK